MLPVHSITAEHSDQLLAVHLIAKTACRCVLQVRKTLGRDCQAMRKQALDGFISAEPSPAASELRLRTIARCCTK